ncbi:MAG: acylphosphatase [Methanosarcinaceae archaeon]
MHDRYCNVSVTGNVHDIGFRNFLESTANSYHIKGYVFNAPDGSVRMLCAGQTESMDNFFDAVRTRKPQGVSIDQFIPTEIPLPGDLDINIPPKFLKLETDELADIGRKLDIGVELLKALPDIKTGIDSMNSKFDDFITEQKVHNKNMDEHNKNMDEHSRHLARILQQFVDKQ